jgi:hypothetical protein
MSSQAFYAPLWCDLGCRSRTDGRCASIINLPVLTRDLKKALRLHTLWESGTCLSLHNHTFKSNSIMELEPASRVELVERWGMISKSILKQENWSVLDNIGVALKTVPKEIAFIFDAVEERTPGIKIGPQQRLMFYLEFSRIALGSSTLHFRDVEAIIQRKAPELMVSTMDFLTLVTSKLCNYPKASHEHANTYEGIDLEQFVSLIYGLMKHQADTLSSKDGKWSFKDIMHQLPLDPDSKPKQIWDLICLSLLMYCSFSVPFGIAFDDDGTRSRRADFEVVLDVVFMTDIFLNFITGWDNQGLIVRDFSLIAKYYLRTWFLPDLAGSFPFDNVITAFMDASQNDLSATNMLRGLRLIRMLKLIRAIKFIAKLEKIKQNEGLEAFGAVITLFRATFVLFFSAHSLGCFFSILMAFEDGDNWLLNYSPELVNGDVPTRYVVSLYWAMISIR